MDRQAVSEVPAPHFDEQAYKLLVDQGHRELADRLLYNRPELPSTGSGRARGSAAKSEAYTDAFNEVFGA